MSRKIRHTQKDILNYLEGDKFVEKGAIKIVVTFHENGRIKSHTFDLTINRSWIKMVMDLCKQYGIHEHSILQIVRSSNI